MSSPLYIVSVIPQGAGQSEIDVTDRVISLTYVEEEKKAPKLELHVDNFDLSNFDDPVWGLGNLVKFSFGYAGRMTEPDLMVIRKVTGSTELKIEAHHKIVGLDKEPHDHEWEAGTTHYEIIRTIAGRHGYRPSQVNVAPFPPGFEQTHGIREKIADAQLVRRLAQMVGYSFWVEDKTFNVGPRQLERPPVKELIYYVDPGRGSILSFHIENDLTRRVGQVRAKGRNPKTKEDIEATADNDTDTDRTALGTVAAVPKPRIGYRRNDYNGGLEQYIIETNTSAESQEEADAAAKGKFRNSQLSAIKMELNIIGDPDIHTGHVIRLSNMGLRLSGNYYVKGTLHSLSGSGGYETVIKAARDGYSSCLEAKTNGQANPDGLRQKAAELAALLESAPPLARPSEQLKQLIQKYTEESAVLASHPTPAQADKVAALGRQVVELSRQQGLIDVASSANDLKAAAIFAGMECATKPPKVNTQDAPPAEEDDKAGNKMKQLRFVRDPDTGALRRQDVEEN